MHALDRSGVQVIECAHGDGLGGSSFNYGFSKVDEFQLIRAAVQEAKIGPDKDIPHVSREVIVKYATDLELLGLL